MHRRSPSARFRRSPKPGSLGLCLILGIAVALGSAAVRADDASKQDAFPPPGSSGVPESTAAAPPGSPAERVLAAAHRMVDGGIVVIGSCYDYVSAVFAEAGYPAERREHVFRSRTGGPYADLTTIEPGDWLAIVNHPERDPVGTHSVIFVRWSDRSRGEAEVVSYAGGSADRPGDVVLYDLSRTYRITRATDTPE